MASGSESGEVATGPGTNAFLEHDLVVPAELAEIGFTVDDAGSVAMGETTMGETTTLTTTESKHAPAAALLQAEASSENAVATLDAVSVEGALPQVEAAAPEAVETKRPQHCDTIGVPLQHDREEAAEQLLHHVGTPVSKLQSLQRLQKQDDEALTGQPLHENAVLPVLGTSIEASTSGDMQKNQQPEAILPDLDTNEVAPAELDKAEQASQQLQQSPPPTPRSQAERRHQLPQAGTVQASASSVALTVTAEQLRKLEARARELRAAKFQAEAKLEAAQALSLQLEAKWAKVSAIADDALRRTDEARQQSTMLRRAAEEKDTHLAQVIDAGEQVQAAKRLAEHRLKQLEASFRERVDRDISQKEQELLEDVAYLRKSIEIKERRAQEASEEKAKLEKRFADQGGGEGCGANDSAMLEAHSTIAKAFADVSASHPLLKLLDEPLLKITGMLFKHPLVRRGFFALSGVMWLYALLHALAFDGNPPIHV